MSDQAHLLFLMFVGFPAAIPMETAWVLAFGARRVVLVALAMFSANALVGCGAILASAILDPPLMLGVFQRMSSAEHILQFATWAPIIVAGMAVVGALLVKLPFYWVLVPPRSRNGSLLLAGCLAFQLVGTAGVLAGFQSGVGTHLAELSVVEHDELGVAPRDGLRLCDPPSPASLNGSARPDGRDRLVGYRYSLRKSVSEGLVVRLKDGGFRRYHLNGPIFRVPIAAAQPHSAAVLLVRVADSVLALALDDDRVAFVCACGDHGDPEGG